MAFTTTALEALIAATPGGYWDTAELTEVKDAISHLATINDRVYANNAAAITGGLTAGQLYRTSTGVLMIVYTT